MSDSADDNRACQSKESPSSYIHQKCKN